MSLALTQNVAVIGIGNTTFFGATGGTPPYTFSILTSGAGGSIDPTSGLYTAPYSLVSKPSTSIDVIQVSDSLAATATGSILVGGVLELICDIIKVQMGLDSNHVYLWDQKINQPTDSSLYVAVSMLNCKPFGNNTTYSTISGSFSEVQSLNMMATVDLDIISRGPEARDKKELVLMALQSNYSVQQQEANSFYISKLPVGARFTNLSNIDGAAIPYRYSISMGVQYFITNTRPIPYFNQFQVSNVVVNS